MRAVLYLRQSVSDSEGIERQRQLCTDLARLRDWHVTQEYVDNDVSASKSRRTNTAWSRMLDDIRAGEIDVIVATKLDRLLRTVGDLGELVDLKAKVVTVDGEIDLTNAFGEFQATLAAGLARFEVRRKSERQRDANAKRAREGRWVGGRRPFGFQADGVTPIDHEVGAIQDGFADVINGVPLAAIARDWNKRGLVTGQTRQARSGHAGEPSPWTASSVRAVLTNPRYAGRVRYQGVVVSHSAEWPAAVDPLTFDTALAILRDPSRRSSPGRSPLSLLSGLALCGVCGSKVHAGGNSRPGVRSYRCAGSLGHLARKSEPVDDYVAAVLLSRLRTTSASDLFGPADDDTKALHGEAATLQARLDSLAIDFAEGELSASQLRAATQRIRERLEAVTSKISAQARDSAVQELLAAGDVTDAWYAYSVERKRSVIRQVATITLLPPGRGSRIFRPETVMIEWISE